MTNEVQLVGGIDHLGLTVPDMETGIAFYTHALGGRLLYRLGPFDSRELSAEGEDWTEAHVGVADALYNCAMIGYSSGPVIELLEYRRPAAANDAPPRNNDHGGHHIAFAVNDLALAIERVVEAGGTALAGPIVVGAGSDDTGSWGAMDVHYIVDPWGNQLELVEHK